jgi:hypothetical protein
MEAIVEVDYHGKAQHTKFRVQNLSSHEEF